MPPASLPDATVGRSDVVVADLTTAYLESVARVAPTECDRARATLARLSPTQWAVEWWLPTWLGAAFGLGESVVHDLSVSSLLGLAAIRTLDDLADGELPAAEGAGARRMADALLAEALRPYRAWFPTGSPFWGRFEAWLAAWRETVSPGQSGRDRLAARGSPLHAVGLAACLLADRAADAPRLEACLDAGLTALVLYDHLVDWDSDVAAGRWNALVAAATSRRQAAPEREALRAEVLRALVATDVLDAYLARIGSACADAARRADELGITPLAQEYRALAARSDDHGRTLRDQATAIRRRASALIFGTEP